MPTPKSKKSARKIQSWFSVAAAALDQFTKLPDEEEEGGPDDFDDEIEVTQVSQAELDEQRSKNQKAALKLRGTPKPLPTGFGGEVSTEHAKTQIESEALFATFVLMWSGIDKEDAEAMALEGSLMWHGLEDGLENE